MFNEFELSPLKFTVKLSEASDVKNKTACVRTSKLTVPVAAVADTVAFSATCCILPPPLNVTLPATPLVESSKSALAVVAAKFGAVDCIVIVFYYYS